MSRHDATLEVPKLRMDMHCPATSKTYLTSVRSMLSSARSASTREVCRQRKRCHQVGAPNEGLSASVSAAAAASTFGASCGCAMLVAAVCCCCCAAAVENWCLWVRGDDLHVALLLWPTNEWYLLLMRDSMDTAQQGEGDVRCLKVSGV